MGWSTRRELAVDVALASAVGVFAVSLGVLAASARPDGGWEWTMWWPHAVMQSIAAAALLFRRQAPLGVMVLMTVFTVVTPVIQLAWPHALYGPPEPGIVWVPVAIPFAGYAVMRYGDRPRHAWLLVWIVVLVGIRPWETNLQLVLGSLAMVALPAQIGVGGARKQRLIAALTDQVRRAEREQHLLAEQARADERRRLAAEMHDVLTHQINLMVLQAGALRVSTGDDAVRRTAEDIRPPAVRRCPSFATWSACCSLRRPTTRPRRGRPTPI